MLKFKHLINCLQKTIKKNYPQTNVMCRPASLLTSNTRISIIVHISLVSRGPVKKISVRAYGLHIKGEDSQVFRNDGYNVNHNRFPSHKNGKISLAIRKTPSDHSIKTRKPSVPPGLLSREPQPWVHNHQQTDRPLPHLQVARASCCTQPLLMWPVRFRHILNQLPSV